ncbi:MAG: ATP-binding cassette domain-containing protein, partial [Synergistaceae bacterium]|nr:ATP-binding cassette domain-containing protein [Synergistaceae bacterium]
MSKVELKNISKVFPDGVRAVDNVTITIENEEFVVLVGPSGCGKSTTLRMIAGLEDISSGELLIDGEL